MGLLLALLIWVMALALFLPTVFGPWGPPEAITELARRIDGQMFVTSVLTGAIFLVSQFLLGYAVWRFGRRRSESARYVESNDRWEALWTSGAAVIFLGLALMGFSAWAEVNFDQERKAAGSADAVVIEVVAQQFVWNFRYPGEDGRFGPVDVRVIDDAMGNPIGVDRDHPDGADDIVVPRIAVPVGRDVELILKAKDVLHNFFVPELRIKLDTVPGIEGRLRFRADKTGSYEIACSELCGLGHYRMRSFVDVMEPEDYERWLAEQAAYLF